MTNTSIDPATITVPEFTPKPPVPKAKPVSARTSSGAWPVSRSTLGAIKADIDDLIAACIERGIDAGVHIREVGILMGIAAHYTRTLLHVPNAPWQKGPDGRYSLI